MSAPIVLLYLKSQFQVERARYHFPQLRRHTYLCEDQNVQLEQCDRLSARNQTTGRKTGRWGQRKDFRLRYKYLPRESNLLFGALD